MKKFLTSILILTIVFSVTLSFASCGISDNYAEVKEQFEEENYEVYVYDSDDYYYTYMEVLFDELNISVDGINRILFAAKSTKNNENSVFVFFCDDKKSAKALEEGIDNAIDKEDAQDFLETYKLQSDTKIKRSGSVVAFGNKEAMKIIT